MDTSRRKMSGGDRDGTYLYPPRLPVRRRSGIIKAGHFARCNGGRWALKKQIAIRIKEFYRHFDCLIRSEVQRHDPKRLTIADPKRDQWCFAGVCRIRQNHRREQKRESATQTEKAASRAWKREIMVAARSIFKLLKPVGVAGD